MRFCKNQALSLALLLWGGLCLQAQTPTSRPATPAVPGKFVDITAKAGVHFQGVASHTSKKYLIETMGSGVALFDYDNDGRLDLFLVNGAPLSDPMAKGAIPQKDGPRTWNRLYHQKQDGTFEDVTEKAGLQGIGYGQGVTVGDYDNDGYEDLFVTEYGRNLLYHNNGNGTFTDVTDKAGVAGGGWSTSAAWVDVDGDGLLDLLVLRYMAWDFDDIYCGEHREGHRAYCHPDLFPPLRPYLYHNDGHGHFTEISEKAGLKPGKGLGVALADYDHDGHIDIFVANDSMLEFLYHNKGDGTFEETGLLSEVAVDDNGGTFAGMGVDFADYDNDSWPDIIVTDLANQKYALYHNNGGDGFTYSSYMTDVGAITLLHSGWGVRLFDYDNDGWKDVAIAQGHDIDNIEQQFSQLHYRESLLLVHNEQGKKFVDVSGQSGDVFEQKWVGRGLAVGDLDNDGRVDLVVTTNDGPAYILHNETPTTNHWITLNLVGHKSNRDGIGADVRLTTSKGQQYATVTTASSYLSSSDKRVHFGLGADAAAQTIEIHWPSGIVQVLKNVAGDRIVQVEEPAESNNSKAGK